jgi:hypothetical protein
MPWMSFAIGPEPFAAILFARMPPGAVADNELRAALEAFIRRRLDIEVAELRRFGVEPPTR